MPPERELEPRESVPTDAAAPALAHAARLPVGSVAALAAEDSLSPLLARAVRDGHRLSNHGVARLLARKKLQSTLANEDIYDDFDEENTHETEFREEIKKIVATIDAKGLTETDPVRYTEAEAAAYNEANKDKPKHKDKQAGHYKSGGGIEGWFTGGELDSARGGKAATSEADARAGKYTTCGEFVSKVWAKAEAAARKRNQDLKVDFGRVSFDGKDMRLTPFTMHLSLLAKAWHPGSELAGREPKKGDCYFLEFPDTGEQSHVGFIKDIKTEGGKYYWVTADGGQRSGAGTADRILERTRLVDRATWMVHGGENADKRPRRLRGWFDVDQVVFYKQ